mgnify:CR=1 FL=1
MTEAERKQIIALGGEVRFSSKLEYIKSNNGKIKSIIVTPQNGSGENAGTKKAFQARHMSQEKNADTPK